MSKTNNTIIVEQENNICSVCGDTFIKPHYSHYACKTSLANQLTEDY
jgi:ribosomal protein S27AE